MRFTATRPEDIGFSLTAELSLKEWIKLRDQLKASDLRGSDPAWGFIRDIDNLIDQATKQFYPRLPPPSSEDSR